MSAIETVHVVATIVLGAVFVLSAVTKLASPALWRGQAAGFGVPAAVATAVPLVELIVGALTTTQVLDPVPSLVALGLLVVFTAAIVANLAHGRRPPCACFGPFSSRPISWAHVARNAAFAAVAVVAVVTA